jgi:acyl-CoA thioesterase
VNQPFIRHVGLHIADSGGGRSELRLRIEPHHLNTNGVVHGGALFTLVDTGMGVALHSALAADERCATVDARISYLKAVREGEVVCTSRLLHRDDKVAHLVSSLTVDGQEIASASGVFTVFTLPGAAATPPDPSATLPSA